MDMVIAGASFPCGVGDLGKVASRHGFNPVFIDHPHNATSIDIGLFPFRFEAGLPEDLAIRNGLLLPLLESWVSAGRDHSKCELRFDRRAAATSCSKYALSKVLAEASISHIPRYQVRSIDEGLEHAMKCGYPVTLRVDSGYSGRGVWIAESADELREVWDRQSNERASADFEKMRTFLNVDDDLLIIEPWLGGDEWSIDCIVGPAGTFMIRICEKVTAIVAGRPVTLGYRLTDSVDLYVELRQAVESWVRALFARDSVSFACFDIRRQSNNNLVPLDFGVRLGSDDIPLLVSAPARKATLMHPPSMLS